MKKHLLPAFACVLALGMMVCATENKPATQTKTGAVTKVDVAGKKITLDLPARPLTFVVTDDTTIAQGDEAKTLADVKEGANVTMEYSRKGENRVAVKITINE